MAGLCEYKLTESIFIHIGTSVSHAIIYQTDQRILHGTACVWVWVKLEVQEVESFLPQFQVKEDANSVGRKQTGLH